ncbi:MAG: right-handed parallel beta-helix repeat-containing protein [Thermoplasmata archaeon]|nr:MAG: right-handed parallel beta-helix repeat-containing protein [Thermoplasmata archaeon]
MVNVTSPQLVDGMNITLKGSLLVYGQIALSNTILRMDSAPDTLYGVVLNSSSIFKGENITIMRNDTQPYFFNILKDANVIINGSIINNSGNDGPEGEEYKKGIHSLTGNLTITNTVIDVGCIGLKIHASPGFIGSIENVTFRSIPGIETESLLDIRDSSGVNITQCNLSARAPHGIYAQSSSNLNISDSEIIMDGDWDDAFYGIFLSDCSNSHIFNNTIIYGRPAVNILDSHDITIESSVISSRDEEGICVERSHHTTIRNCTFGHGEDEPRTAMYMSWCSNSVIEDMVSIEIQNFLKMENESTSTLRNLNISGETGIWLKYSNNINVYDTYIHFIYTGMIITGCRDIYLTNTTITLTFYCLTIRSPGPVKLSNCTLANGIAGEMLADGYEGELGEVLLTNSTIISITEESMVLNNSAVVSLINTSFNLTRLRIKDGASRVEVYHYLSLQVYDIDNSPPALANITIFNAMQFMVYFQTVPNGHAAWVLIHDRTVFRDENYSDNPYLINFFDGRHAGSQLLFINYSQHVDVHVHNELPYALLVNIYGVYDMPDPIPDIITPNPTTNFDIALNYTYFDQENDPESGTVIHWIVEDTIRSAYNGWTTIPSQYTAKGERWQAKVYPSDGYDSTYPDHPYESNVIRIENTPPEVSNVTVSPSEPTGGDDLFVNYDFYDVDGDDLAFSTTHRWYFWNEGLGAWEYIGVDSFYLSSQYTSKGQLWKCNVTPHDGDDAGIFEDSQIVMIGNTPPVVQNPKVISETGDAFAKGSDNLKVAYNFTDVDGDSENGTKYVWYLDRDGSGWTPYFVNSSVLPFNYTQRGDLWRCKIVPADGEDFGPEAWTDAVEIINTPPQVSNVSVLPSYATSSDNLSVSYDFYDYDGDADNGTSFRWVYEDAFGVGWDSGIIGNVAHSQAIYKGQTWFCYVTPSDGVNVGTEVRSAGVIIHNTPPIIAEAEVEVATEGGNLLLRLHHTALDTDGDEVIAMEIHWFQNNQSQPELNDNHTVAQDFLIKGQSWSASIRAFDGENWSKWSDTNNVSIPNIAPYIRGTVTLSPQKAKSNEDLIPSYVNLFKDDDGDAFSKAWIKWYRDNGHMEAHDNSTQLPWYLTKKGEIWFCKVRVFDGDDWSDWYSSTTSVIENSPPSNVTLEPHEGTVTMTETESLKFNASAKDTDEDTLSYRWMLDGRIVQLEEGVANSIYLHKTDYTSEGDYILRLVVSDGDDIYENTWIVIVHKKNRLPKITVVGPEGRSAEIDEGESLTFSITKSDPDGDGLDVRWLLDGVKVWEASDKYTYSPDYYSSGSRNVTVEVFETESGENSTYTWSVEVEDVEDIEKVERLLGQSYDWWGLVLAILSGVVAILLAVIGLLRVRRKKNRMKEHMMEMDRVMEEEEDPSAVDDKLEEFEQQIREEFSQGKLEDLHFLLLQEVIASKRGAVRKAVVTRKFGRLPEGVIKDLDEMLKDGKISKEEYGTFMSTISKSETLSPQEKEELSKMIAKWEEEDKDIFEEEPVKDGIETKDTEELEIEEETEPTIIEEEEPREPEHKIVKEEEPEVPKDSEIEGDQEDVTEKKREDKESSQDDFSEDEGSKGNQEYQKQKKTKKTSQGMMDEVESSLNEE